MKTIRCAVCWILFVLEETPLCGNRHRPFRSGSVELKLFGPWKGLERLLVFTDGFPATTKWSTSASELKQKKPNHFPRPPYLRFEGGWWGPRVPLSAPVIPNLKSYDEVGVGSGDRVFAWLLINIWNRHPSLFVLLPVRRNGEPHETRRHSRSSKTNADGREPPTKAVPWSPTRSSGTPPPEARRLVALITELEAVLDTSEAVSTQEVPVDSVDRRTMNTS